jgi:hypothetical protein
MSIDDWRKTWGAHDLTVMFKLVSYTVAAEQYWKGILPEGYYMACLAVGCELVSHGPPTHRLRHVRMVCRRKDLLIPAVADRRRVGECSGASNGSLDVFEGKELTGLCRGAWLKSQLE